MSNRTTVLLSAAVLSTLAWGAVAGTMAGTMADAPMAGPAAAPVIVGGQPMLPGRTIVDNAVNSADHTTLVAAVKAAGLVDTLRGAGPFTVFAPTDAAFRDLPAGTVDTLVKPENKGALTRILTYHVVPGRLDAAALKQRIAAGNGEATLKTVNGAILTASMNGPHNIAIRDGAGTVANISTYDVHQANGVIHVVDTVLMPG
ncbi:fasciclin domain-containing protein [Azospirillum sp. ST 5-10]|uniref:fasciclin domain-containing protein n=1 Tax=unclassified Azospirillum TaxID=2630922 RepID=UPI003F49D804